MDAHPQPASVLEQVIEQKLVQCGLKSGGFTVRFEDDLQSIEVVIGTDAGATSDKFDCIRQAADHEIVTFSDGEMQKAYDDRASDLLKPQMLAEARVGLEKRGLLDGFPERSEFSSDKLFAEALERHCGMKAGSFFVKSHGELIGKPKGGKLSKADRDRLSCLMNAILYVSAKGENLKFGFVGNEAVVPDQ